MLEMVRDGRENFIFSVDIVEASDTALIGFEDGKIEVWDSKTINKLFTFELIDCYSKVTEMFASSESNRSILRFYVRKDGKLSFIEVNMIEKINQILVLDSTEDIEHSKFSRIYCSDFDLLECTDNTNKVVLRKVNKVIEIFMLLEEENDVAQWKTKMNGKVDKLRKVLMPQMVHIFQINTDTILVAVTSKQYPNRIFISLQADLIGPEICFTKWLPISASFDTMKFCNTTCAFKENGDLYLLNLLSAMEDRDLSMQKHIRLISKCTGVFELKELGANVFLNMVESNEVRIICCDK